LSLAKLPCLLGSGRLFLVARHRQSSQSCLVFSGCVALWRSFTIFLVLSFVFPRLCYDPASCAASVEVVLLICSLRSPALVSSVDAATLA
jgi:hypothetical protein